MNPKLMPNFNWCPFITAGLIISYIMFFACYTSLAQSRSAPSIHCHVTDGDFTSCPDGNLEWSDVPFAHFPSANSYLYADQADIDPNLQSIHPITGAVTPHDTFMLFYDECNTTTPLGPDEYFLINFDTVEVEGGLEQLDRYTVHAFSDGTIIFFKNGVLQTNGNGEYRLNEIAGQRGSVGFGPSPNCPFDHVRAEYQITLQTASGNSYSPDPLFWGATPPGCTVSITGGSPLMNVGQQVEFTANVSGGGGDSFQWTVEGDIVKDYSETTNRPWSTMAMAPGDFQQKTISFYWKPLANQKHPNNAGPQPRKVSVNVTEGNSTCNAERTINVERNNTDITKQAEDFFTSNHSRRTLTEHTAWHVRFRFDRASQGGALFFDFHNQYISRFNSWRAEFGYPSVGIWDPATPLPTGIDIDHSPRPGTTTAAAHGKPSWFTIPGGTTGRPRNGWVCDTGAGQTRLADFPANQKLLGCATESPWHNSIHVALGGDMRRPSRAPRDPIFWRWHNFVDTISQDRRGLTPPTLVYQSPFRLFHFITELPSVSITFSEPVTGVTADDLMVNGATAFSVTGSGEGPYVFTGFPDPGFGPVIVEVAPGGIMDLNGELFEGETWEHTLIDSTPDDDADGVSNGEEVDTHLTDPTNPDTDDDGLPDGFEIDNACLDPLVDQANPHDMAGNPLPGNADTDNDGLTDLEEFFLGSDPCSFTFVPGQGAVRPGFDSSLLPANDDGSTGLVALGFSVNFFGTDLDQLFVNNNGNVTLDAALSSFTPFDLTTTGRQIIAPFFSDVDTRVGNVVTYGSGTVEGLSAFGVTWPGVGCYSTNISVLNFFQVVLIERSDIAPGDFDIEFNYDSIQWETGQASGGDDVCQGGSAARAGFSNGTGEPGSFFELPGSGIPGAFLDSNTLSGLVHHSLNSNEQGRYVFPVRNGIPTPIPTDNDGDNVLNELDNCPNISNPDQEDQDLNGIGDACQSFITQHSTAGFLQAWLDTTTTAEPTSLNLDEEPTVIERLIRIVNFRLNEGLSNSPVQLIQTLVNSLITLGLVPETDAEHIISTVVDSTTLTAEITFQPVFLKSNRDDDEDDKDREEDRDRNRGKYNRDRNDESDRDDKDRDWDREDNSRKTVKAFIELPENQDPNNIDLSSIRFNGNLPSVTRKVKLRDRDKDGIPELVVKFNRKKISPLLSPGIQEFRVTGKLIGGTQWAGVGLLEVKVKKKDRDDYGEKDYDHRKVEKDDDHDKDDDRGNNRKRMGR